MIFLQKVAPSRQILDRLILEANLSPAEKGGLRRPERRGIGLLSNYIEEAAKASRKEESHTHDETFRN
jgi:hypothetical protein